MTVAQEYPTRTSSHTPVSVCLEDKFEILKEIGDGSFGSVALARVRTAGAYVARRGSLIAVKTMKKTFDSFAPCLELREVIFLRSLPTHAHLVPALDIFLDPVSRKLHICMEYMDGNLYQLMKARDHKCLDGSSVKSILYQILGGLEHIHAHNFFHRDIKPENILVSTSALAEPNNTFRRYSSLVTPPSTPPLYTIKIADFGLARETYSQHPYTTYVSTRWYRAPEVLLRAGEYSAPVDMWAIGAMAVEIANLKPLFPGGNEVDQVWRVCEIMGSPGNWYDKSGNRVGGGDWREGQRLASKLGFSFPKMAPHSMETILRPPQWPVGLSNFVTWCLMWDPRNRPTSAQALNHEYFADAVDPLRPKSSTSRLLGRKHSTIDSKVQRDSSEIPALSTKSSWFRKSFVGKENSPGVPPHNPKTQTVPTRPQPVHATTVHTNTPSEPPPSHKNRHVANKRATWTNGTTTNIGAPMPILPSIRPISPFSATVNAQAHTGAADPNHSNIQHNPPAETRVSKKIGRQLSVNSHGNHYGDIHRQEAERALNGNGEVTSPNGAQKEGFFSHLRKRARRLSGRPQAPMSPTPDDIEANAGCGPWQSNRSSLAVDPNLMEMVMKRNDYEVDRALQSVRHSAEASSPPPSVQPSYNTSQGYPTPGSTPGLERHTSATSQTPGVASAAGGGPISTRTRRALQLSTHPSNRYETPDEEDELLHEALHSAQKAVRDVDTWKGSQTATPPPAASDKNTPSKSLHRPPEKSINPNPYPTPSPSAKREGILFNQKPINEPASPLNIQKTRSQEEVHPKWPTPPYDENEWAASAAASIFAAGSLYR
ncbi:MAG: hypothetical protein Q9191_007842 [Dirinaria sp. TL-2023a]